MSAVRAADKWSFEWRLVVEGQDSVKAETVGAQNGAALICIDGGLEVRMEAGDQFDFRRRKGGDITSPAVIILEGDSFENTPRITSETFSRLWGDRWRNRPAFRFVNLSAAAEISTPSYGLPTLAALTLRVFVRLAGSDLA